MAVLITWKQIGSCSKTKDQMHVSLVTAALDWVSVVEWLLIKHVYKIEARLVIENGTPLVSLQWYINWKYIQVKPFHIFGSGRS